MMIRLAAILFAALAATLPARAFETLAGAAWVYDLTTDTVLLEKNAREKLPPASMSKLMTVNMLFEALRDGRVALDTQFAVSSKAKSMGGSKMFLDERDRPTVEDLIRGIIVHSGNDATVVVAEGLAGSEDNFAKLMTTRARAIGLEESSFGNASGLPDPRQLMSVRDLGLLAKRLINEFPEYYGYFSITSFTWKGITQPNRDPLLYRNIGADGLKTGFTDESGYGLVGSAKQGDRRVVFVIAGLPDEKTRAEEGERIVNWAFREFVQKTVATKGTAIADADVWMGSSPKVSLVIGEDVSMLLPSLAQEKLTGEVKFTGPFEAPIAEGQKLADLTISVPGMAPAVVPLVAGQAVTRGGFTTRLRTAFGILTRRVMAEVGS